MPRYYFDVHDGRGVIRDEEGLDLNDTRDAEREALLALAEMAKLLTSSEFPQRVTIDVRSDVDRIAVAKLTLDLERLRRAD